MDAVLSGNSCQGRDVAYLRVTNNWQRDREDYKEKTRRTGGGDHRVAERGEPGQRQNTAAST